MWQDREAGEMDEEVKVLKYVGNGFLPGVPAKDLTAEEVKAAGGETFLLKSKLYVKISKKEQEVKHGTGN
jgi:hypothetical protein